MKDPLSNAPVSPESSLIFYWDFFGPRAEGTARHFEIHLDEFLEREAIEGCEIGVESSNPTHWAAWCRAPQRLENTLTLALKPRRQVLVGAASTSE